MREYRVVKVSEIDIGDRLLDPEDDFKPLCDDIRKNGMHDPILVDTDLKLIDGLRRLQAFKKHDDVDVVITDDYVDTMEIMLLSVGKPFTVPWTPRRTWDFHIATMPQRKLHHYIRVLNANGKKKEFQRLDRALPNIGPMPSNSISRDLMAKFSGHPGSWVQAVIYLYGRATGETVEPDADLRSLAVDLVKKLDAGYNVWTARNDYEKARRRTTGHISKASEQRQILSSSASTASSLVKVLRDFAEVHKNISRQDAEEYRRVFTQLRSELHVMNTKLTERIKKA